MPFGNFVVTCLFLNGGGIKTMNKEELRETRKLMMAQMEQKLQERHPKEEDRMFYYHSSEFLSLHYSHPLPRDSKFG